MRRLWLLLFILTPSCLAQLQALPSSLVKGQGAVAVQVTCTGCTMLTSAHFTITGTAVINSVTIEGDTQALLLITPAKVAENDTLTETVSTKTVGFNSTTKATWYVRPDGGTRYSAANPTGTCNGTADAAPVGTTPNQNCAFGLIMNLWTDGSYCNDNTQFSSCWQWIGNGGDAYIVKGSIALGTPSYRIGQIGPNSGDYYGLAGNPYGAGAPQPHPGSPTYHTLIAGQNYGNCTTQSARTPVNGGYGVGSVWNFINVSYIDWGCFDTTDHSNCGRNAQTNGCNTNYPLSDYATTGITTNYTTHDVTLSDFRNHGLASLGMQGPTGDNVKINDMQLAGNAGAGWNADLGDLYTGVGKLVVTNFSLIASGCAEEYPIVDPMPYADCTDDNIGGYGDAFGTSTVGALANYTIGTVYNYQLPNHLYGYNGSTYLWMTAVSCTVSAGALPLGMSLNSSTCALGGTPTQQYGISKFSVLETPSYGSSYAWTFNFQIGGPSTPSGGGWNVSFNNGLVQYSTQDGLDALHLTGAGSSMTITHVQTNSNMGQQLKIGGAHGVADNNSITTNCNAMRQTLTGWPSGYNSRLSDFCRANDSGVVISPQANAITSFRGNTVYCASATCVEVDGDGSATQLIDVESNNFLLYTNNTANGYPGGGSGQQSQAIGDYSSASNLCYPGNPCDSAFNNTGSLYSNNAEYNGKDPCPATYLNELNAYCSNPNLTNETWPLYGLPGGVSTVSAYAMPLSGSGVIAHGLANAAVTNDFNYTPRLATNPTSGAVEFFNSSLPTLTLTGNNVISEVGDAWVMPCNVKITGYSGSDTWTTAVASGMFSTTSSITSTTPVGTYTCPLSSGTMTSAGTYNFNFVSGNNVVVAQDGLNARINPNLIGQPSGVWLNALTQTLTTPAITGNGVTDDTTAIQNLLSLSTSLNGFKIYFPCGNYRISNTLSVATYGKTVIGAGPCTKFIASAGKFSSANCGTGKPSCSNAAVWYFTDYMTNEMYFTYLENISIEIEPGNAIAFGVTYDGSNESAIRNIPVTFDDSVGNAGFRMNLSATGPLMARDLAVNGSTDCFLFGSTYQIAAAHFTTMNCPNAITNGIRAGTGLSGGGLGVPLYGLLAYNHSLIYQGNSAASGIMGASIYGGGGTTAFTNGSTGAMYLSAINMYSTGFTNWLTDVGLSGSVTKVFNPANPLLAEYWTGPNNSLFNSSQAGGMLTTNPIQDTPLPDAWSDPVLANHCQAPMDITTWGTNIASCTDANWDVPVACNYGPGATSTCTGLTYNGVYSGTAGTYHLVPPDAVHVINLNNSHWSGIVIDLDITSLTSTDPIFIIKANNTATTLFINHSGTRPIVIYDAAAQYTCSGTPGDLWMENYVPTGQTFCSGQHIHGFQYDNEYAGNDCTLTHIASTGTVFTFQYASSSTCNTFNQIGLIGVTTHMSAANVALQGFTFSVASWTSTQMTANVVGATTPVVALTTENGWVRNPVPKLTLNNCASATFVGYKSEGIPTLINTNCPTSVYGFYSYANSANYIGQTAFTSANTPISFWGTVQPQGTNYTQNYIGETQLGVTRYLPVTVGSSNPVIGMYRSYGVGPPPVITNRTFKFGPTFSFGPTIQH